MKLAYGAGFAGRALAPGNGLNLAASHSGAYSTTGNDLQPALRGEPDDLVRRGERRRDAADVLVVARITAGGLERRKARVRLGGCPVERDPGCSTPLATIVSSWPPMSTRPLNSGPSRFIPTKPCGTARPCVSARAGTAAPAAAGIASASRQHG